jgi:hypothetical protein
MKSDKANRVKENAEFSKKVRGILRKEHFSNGGTLESWRGKNKIQSDKKKDISKKTCREGNPDDQD